MKILVTGGPVHAQIDAVKFVTNRFKGGLMAKLAGELASMSIHVTYLCSKDSAPAYVDKVVYHEGFHDYREKVLEMAPHFDAVVLGAAVANLIPVSYFNICDERSDCGDIYYEVSESVDLPLKGKFPSHDFKPGDAIMMKWQIAPRIIDEVHPVMKQGAHLFGFKLLGGVPHEELVSAAYGVLLESKATAVFANDVTDLQSVTAITKERGEHQIGRDGLAHFIKQCVSDEYYRTNCLRNPVRTDASTELWVRRLLDGSQLERFLHTPEGFVFGTVAMRNEDDGGFMTTGRGKRELDEIVHVVHVDHKCRVVTSVGGKPSLNAPLLASIFEDDRVERIEHYHDHVDGLCAVPYAPPGTVRDSIRLPQLNAFGFKGWTSFNIHNHGCFLLFDKDGKQL